MATLRTGVKSECNVFGDTFKNPITIQENEALDLHANIEIIPILGHHQKPAIRATLTSNFQLPVAHIGLRLEGDSKFSLDQEREPGSAESENDETDQEEMLEDELPICDNNSSRLLNDDRISDHLYPTFTHFGSEGPLDCKFTKSILFALSATCIGGCRGVTTIIAQFAATYRYVFLNVNNSFSHTDWGKLEITNVFLVIQRGGWSDAPNCYSNHYTPVKTFAKEFAPPATIELQSIDDSTMPIPKRQRLL